MRGIYFNGKTAQYREDLIKPTPSKGQSLLRVLLAAVCSTDREILKGYRPDFHGIMGHEFVAVVEESDRPELVGKRVVGEINEFCGECLYCKTGRPHHCIHNRTPGISMDGCFAEYLVLQTDLLHVLPDTLSDEVAVFTEPLAAAFEITEQVSIRPGTPVAIIGDGRLALCIANVLALKGADLTILGHHEEKLKLFERFGHVSEKAGPESFEIVVDACGSPTGLETAFRLVRRKGTIVLKSTYASPVTFQLSQIPVNELTIVGSRCGPFEPAISALNDQTICLPEIELHDLSDYSSAFASTAFKAGFKI